MESEFRNILMMAKQGKLNHQQPPIATPVVDTAKLIGGNNEIIVVKKKGNMFKILKYIIILGVLATIGGIVYMCVKRVKNSQETIVPYTPIKLDDISSREDEENEDNDTLMTNVEDDEEEEEDDSYKYDEQFTLLEDLPKKEPSN